MHYVQYCDKLQFEIITCILKDKNVATLAVRSFVEICRDRESGCAET